MKKEDIAIIQQNEAKFKEFLFDYFKDYEHSTESIYYGDETQFEFQNLLKDIVDIKYDLNNERIDITLLFGLDEFEYYIEDYNCCGDDYEGDDDWVEPEENPDLELKIYATPTEGGRIESITIISNSDDLDNDLCEAFSEALECTDEHTFSEIDLEEIIDEFIKTI